MSGFRLNNWFLIFLTYILSINLVSASTDVDFGDKNVLESNVIITNTFQIIPSSNSYSIKYIDAQLNSVPFNDYRQSVSRIDSIPDATIGESANYRFEGYQKEYSLKLDSDVKTIAGMLEVKSKVQFPITTLDTSLYQYLEPSEIIDITPEIRNLASELVANTDDLYEVEYIFAEYVRKNIAYDLGTLTSEANQKSSWVLENKRGVCDEITNLFISLNRASGIPARFVSGISYTNLDDVFGESWIPHAWAEVYFPGVGWVPYDVTYGQYGFIDASHIALSDRKESGGSGVSYSYFGNDIKLVPGDLDIDVIVQDFGEDATARYTFDANIHTRDVGFGSYNMISVYVENDMSYYQVADLYLGETQGISIIEDSKETVLNKTVHRKQVLLRPKESKTVYWIVKVDKNLDSGFVYTFPITVYNTYNYTSTTFIQSKKGNEIFDENYFKNLLATIQSSEKNIVNIYSKYIFLECNSNKNELYLNDEAKITCVLDNIGDKSFDSVSICFDDECVSRNLGVEKLSFEYDRKFESEGLKTFTFKVSGKDFIKSIYVPINVLDKPKMVITDISHPKDVSYDEDFNIDFKISKDSKSTPKNVKIILMSQTNTAEWTFEAIDDEKSFSIKSSGNTMKPNINEYKIIVTFEDEKGNNYAVQENFNINSNAKFFEDILLYLNVLGNMLEKSLG